MAKRSAHTSQPGTKPTTLKRRRRTSKVSTQATCTSEGSHDSHAEDEEGDQQSDDEDEAASGSPGHSLVACQNCRRRKSKCSKTHPCSQCVKLNVACLYHTRGRPGLKIGAVESLANRLSDLEQMFLGQSMLLQSCLLGDRTQSSPAPNSLAAQTALLRERCLDSAHLASSPLRLPSSDTAIAEAFSEAQPAAESGPAQNPTCRLPSLPPRDVLYGVVDWYFAQVHRWIPILDRQRFEERLRAQSHGSAPNLVLLAMLSMGLRLWQHPAADHFRASSADYRSTVLLRGMEGVSIETLQALAIVAFDIIGSGHGPSAWSVIGSMSRTVEQIRLNAEEESADTGRSQLRANEVLLRRIRFLRPSQNWVEEEERRRLFWSIFMMDRFCSVTTGWSNSLGIQNCRRRLPCEGSLWRLRTLVRTPFFGDGVKRRDFVSRDSSPRPSGLHEEQSQYPTDEVFPDPDSTADGIGGFAYCIEATESLNLVTNFLLQHSLAFREAKEAQRWLMRFRDLDLRLIKWRFFLPEKWRDASAPNHDGILDPNLVLAHLTHNTAVIQLHQAVAFKPSKVQPFSVELPQASSLQTCLAAANEIGTIALHFLDQEAGIVSPQVAVCLFIAARSLLTHSKVCQLPVSASFDTLSAALQRVSERWSSSQAAVAQDGEVRPLLPLASRLSERLAMAKKSLHTVGEVPLAMSIEQPVYSGHAARSRANSIGPELEHDIPGQPPRRQHKSSTQHGETPAYEGAADQAGLKPSRSTGGSGHFDLVDASNGSTSAAQMVDPDLTLFTLLPDFFEPTPATSLTGTGFSEAFPTADLSLGTAWPLASNENRSTPQPGAPALSSERRTATVESNSDGVSEIDEMLDMLMQNQNGAMGRDFRVSRFDSNLPVAVPSSIAAITHAAQDRGG